MAIRYICTQGHHWDSQTGNSPDASHAPEQCPVCGAAVALPISSPPTSDGPWNGHPSIAGYDILQVLSPGDHLVYLARNRGHNRIVTLTVYPIDASELPSLRAKLEAAARVQHPNLVSILEVAEHQGQLLVARERVDGPTLAETLDGRPQPDLVCAQMIEILARAIHCVHRQGLVHGHLEPGNVVLETAAYPGPTPEGKAIQSLLPLLLPAETPGDHPMTMLGVPRITGLGFAHHRGPIEAQPLKETNPDNAFYLAPEQVRGEAGLIGPAVDVHALGGMLYEMLTGRPPFLGVTGAETALQITSSEVIPPRQVRPGVARDLETICLRCLEKGPARRYASAEDLALDLRRFVVGAPIQSQRLGYLHSLWRRTRQHPRAASLIIGFMAIIATIFVYLYGQWQQAEAMLQAELAERHQVEADFRQALQAVELTFAEVSETAPFQAASMEALRKHLLEATRAFSESFSAAHRHDPAMQPELARAALRLAIISEQTAAHEQAITWYRQAQSIFEDLLAHDPDLRTHRRGLAQSLSGQASAQAALGRPERALAVAPLAIEVYEVLQRDEPSNVRYPILLAQQYQQQAMSQRALNQFDLAEASLQQSLHVLDKLVHDHPGVGAYQDSLAKCWTSLGGFYQSVGRLGPAEEAMKKAVALREQQGHDRAGVLQGTVELGQAYGNLATFYRLIGKSRDSVSWYDRAIVALADAARRDERLPDSARLLGAAQEGKALALLRLQAYTPALAALNQAVGLTRGAPQERLRVYRALALVHTNQHAQAVADAKVLATRFTDADALYNLACVFSLACKAVGEDPVLSFPEKIGLVETYAAQALALLKRADAAGCFQTPEQVHYPILDPDMSPLHERADFQNWWTTLEQRSAKAGK
jgi:serine/threonine protein kinase